MRNGKVYWVKQKIVGLLLIIIPVLFMDIFRDNDAFIIIPLYWLLGCLIIRERTQITCMFRTDYIFDLRLFIRRIRRRNKMRRLRSGRL